MAGRLIDADALIAMYGDWYTEEGTEDGYIGELHYLLDTVPTIDAIPVEWLDDRANDITRAPLFRRYAQQLLDEWQQEQEA